MATTMQDTMSQHYAEQYGINFEPDSYDPLTCAGSVITALVTQERS